MRRARIKVSADKGDAVYHLISRTVNGEWLLHSTEKEVLRRQMWQVAEFTGVQIITYTVMSNHFHMLVRVPQRGSMDDVELLRRYQVLYPEPTNHQAAQLPALESMLRADGPDAGKWRQRQLSLMYDVSAFMKLVKVRFSIWFNKRHGRFGPVWADRFKSVLVEPHGSAIQSVAAYIDLNCVRAGIVRDPKGYRFCGYAEAIAGSASARRGLQLVAPGNWSEAQCQYRLLLFSMGTQMRSGRGVLTADELQKVVHERGTVALPELLRCRLRYFTQGAVIGSRAFVEKHVAEYRLRFGCGSRVRCRDFPPITEWTGLAGLRPIGARFFG